MTPALKKHSTATSAAQAIAGDIHAAEKAIDEALIHLTCVGQTLAEGRLSSDVSATFGHAMFEDLGTSIQSTIMLRGQVVSMHNRMARNAQRLGVEVTMGPEKPPTKDGEESPWPKAARLAALAD